MMLSAILILFLFGGAHWNFGQRKTILADSVVGSPAQHERVSGLEDAVGHWCLTRSLHSVKKIIPASNRQKPHRVDLPSFGYVQASQNGAECCVQVFNLLPREDCEAQKLLSHVAGKSMIVNLPDSIDLLHSKRLAEL